jgi:hypothetical protein
MIMYDDDHIPGTSLFDEDADECSFERRIAGPSGNVAQSIARHLQERQASGKQPYWPDWDKDLPV